MARSEPQAARPPVKLDHAFFARPAIDVARDLIGTVLVRRTRGREFRGRIVETEAYIGTHDLACHASKGRTKRTQTMFGPAGRAYIYLIYGMHDMLNIVTSEAGDAQAVLIRAAEPLDGWEMNLSGPGRLARGFQIRLVENGLDLTGDNLFLQSRTGPPPRILPTKRIGVDYAKEWRDELLRFTDADSPAVSKPRLGPA